MRYHLISLGCPKNTVDAQGIARLLNAAGHVPTADAQAADLLIVNTCGFIAEARDESLAILRELATTLRPGQRLVAAGCMAQYTPQMLRQAVPELSGLLGTRRWSEVLDLVKKMQTHPGQVSLIGDPLTTLQAAAHGPRTAVQGAPSRGQRAAGPWPTSSATPARWSPRV